MSRSKRSKSQRAGILAVALLAGLSVRLDDIYYRRPLDQWLWVDWIVGLLLAVSAGIAVLGTQRLLESRARITELARRTSGIADVAWVVSRSGGHMGGVLDHVAEQTCQMVATDRATICVLDRNDPRTSVVVAGHGTTDDLIGRRFGIDEGMMSEVFFSNTPVMVDHYRDFWVKPGGDKEESDADGKRVGAAAPIRWGGEVRGALSVVREGDPEPFDETDLELISRLADLSAVALEQTEMHERLEIAHSSGVDALTAAIDLRDKYTWRHSQNVMKLAGEMGRRLELDEAALAEISLAARLHDIGKIGVPDSILLKEGPLDPEEWDVIKCCPTWGAGMVERVPSLSNVAAIVRCVHEHWNGSGYPAGLEGEAIPLASRVILVCAAYDAMIQERPYRKAFEPWTVVRKLRAGAGLQFDPAVVEMLTAVLRESRLSTPFSGVELPPAEQPARTASVSA
jgi:HD-GYP domain-containing protein (c-di-GMP phosphodiesterase class II)